MLTRTCASLRGPRASNFMDPPPTMQTTPSRYRGGVPAAASRHTHTVARWRLNQPGSDGGSDVIRVRRPGLLDDRHPSSPGGPAAYPADNRRSSVARRSPWSPPGRRVARSAVDLDSEQVDDLSLTASGADRHRSDTHTTSSEHAALVAGCRRIAELEALRLRGRKRAAPRLVRSWRPRSTTQKPAGHSPRSCCGGQPPSGY